ncbi:MAG: NADH-quinone oxidoreductase subunit L [Candidatus Coatesbacteria bacterium]|nr:MAG: NADH-quinone oxidoreductase subunit L [Candidatus Coatesbacteria bacterium]
MTWLAAIVNFTPLLGFLIAILWGKRLGEPKAAIAPVAALGVSFAASVALFVRILLGHGGDFSFTWFAVGGYELHVGFQLDRFGGLMALVVTTVSFMIHIYSTGYMHGDKLYGRYFAYLNLFSAAMLGLVLANNYLQAFIFWELVGLTSYLLIGFWFEKPEAANAGMKAFITTRLGDVGLLIGILLVFTVTGTFHFGTLFGLLEHGALAPALVVAAALLVFAGAVGKSAQLPLHVWLPDAMEGPTPVSALIHAATMVAAGVYLVARSFPLFVAASAASEVVAYVGAATALMAATIAVVQVDIKRVLAYSTISQLGYMMLALGCGSQTAGIFHLYTHAFFKALLFLGAGAVIHACHTNDMREMGGLGRRMKGTAITFVVAALALAGIPPLSGFFSKDEILVAVVDHGGWFLAFAAFFTVFLTAFYMFRAIFLTFGGDAKEKAAGAHEAPWKMLGPMVFLCLLAVVAGWVGIPGVGPGFAEIAGFHVHGEHHGFNFGAAGASLALALGGIALAWALYHLKVYPVAKIYKRFRPIAFVLERKYFFDDVYGFLFVKGTVAFARAWGIFDNYVVDGAVNGSAWLTVMWAKFKGWFDLAVVDGLVNFAGWITQGFGKVFRRIQTGYVQEYLLVLACGVVAILIAVLIMI